MAKPLILNFGGADLPLALFKVERSDLYGYVEIETLDEQGRKCAIATLANDGKCVMAVGGSALASLSPDGQWMERKALIATDQNGQRIAPVPSSYAAPVPLTQTASIDEYLEHNIRAVYQISSDADPQRTRQAKLEWKRVAETCPTRECAFGFRFPSGLNIGRV